MSNFHIISEKPSIIRAVRVEFSIRRNTRKFIRRISVFFTILGLIVGVAAHFYHTPGGLLLRAESPAFALALFFGAVLWFMIFLEFYFLSTSQPIKFLTIEPGDRTYYLDLGGARRFYYVDAFHNKEINIGLLYGFLLQSNFVQILLTRLGIGRVEFESFLRAHAKKTLVVPREQLFETLIKEADESGSQTFGAKEFMVALFDIDKDFQQFLFNLHIRRTELAGGAEWSARIMENLRKNERWWEKESLGRVPGIWSNLGFGRTFMLDKYSSPIAGDRNAFGGNIRFISHKKELLQIEEILSRSSQSNALLVGEQGSGRHTVLSALASFIVRGIAMPSLEHKQLIHLDTVSLVANLNNKASLEEGLIKLMNEAVLAGNVILVIDNFPEFLESSRMIGADVLLILEQYLQNASFQVIGLSDLALFQRQLMRDGRIVKLFEKVEIKETTNKETILVLEDIAPIFERHNNILITYQALDKIVSFADLYITDGIMPEKAIDLMDRCVSSLTESKVKILLPEHIEQTLSVLTNIPSSHVSQDEAAKLLHLEDELHKRVVGQEEAIRVIADALRRVRSGLHSGKRPIGTFLFFGPTGVGKTETAKALAEVYFGSAKNMTRCDMSEYQGLDGVAKLIGSFDRNEPGILALALKEYPFGLLLFDEFEKATREVHNLFLQILDEGFFTDAFGKKVNLRQSIIIATSNAGSSVIWELLQRGVDPNTLKDQVIDQIRKDQIFSPELLNRFDAAVIFHPLDKEKLQNVARMMLEEFAGLLKEKEITFKITDALVMRVAEIGYDPLMGARPMRRAIQDKVEQLIAKKILAGSLERGGTIELTSEEVASL